MRIDHAWRILVPLGLALGAPAAAAGEAPAPREYHFEVLLDDKPIGTHRYRVVPGADGAEQVLSEAEFQVRFLGLTVYRYRHRAEESWRDGCLLRLDATTNDNGDVLAVQGAQADGMFQLQQPGTWRTGRRCLAAYAYWDLPRLMRQSELLNPQTGKLDQAQLEYIGEESLSGAKASMPARRYRLRAADLEIHLWYDTEGRWLQLASTARGNRELRYRLRG
jgi:hypothetical protein